MKNILIVEDHADIRRLIRMTLEFEDVQITEAATAQQGWDLACQTSPDLVLLDVMMPGEMNGLDLCRALKAHPELAHVPVIMLSARDAPGDREQGLAAGAQCYLVKPFSPMQLLELLHDVVAA
jgi:CheY-like chemotaxis protein